MSWIGKVAGVDRRKEHGIDEAVRHAADAIDVLDRHCQTLGADVAALDARQAASEAVQAEHEWALTALREEIEALKRALSEASRDNRSS